MYQRIFVPIDHSKVSDRAFEESCSLAKTLKAELLIATVVDLSVAGQAGMEFGDVLDLHKITQSTAKKLLKQALDKAKSEGIPAQTKLLENFGSDPSKILLDEAKSWEAHLIVMGTHGRTGLKHLIMGSVAEGILRRSPVPVLLLRHDDKK